MLTVDYIEVQQGACEAIWGTSVDLPDVADWGRLRRIINNRLGDAWEYAWWPGLMKTEQRKYRAEWASGTTYAAGAEVYYTPSKTYYQSLRSHSGQAPATGADYAENSAYWAECRASYSPNRGDWLTATAYAVGDQVYYQPTNAWYQCYTAHTSSGTLVPDATGGNARWGVLTPFHQSISYTQSGETEIGLVDGVYMEDPRLARNASKAPFTLEDDTIYLVVQQPTVWVRFMEPAPDLRGNEFDTAVAYAVGQGVYFASATTPGNFYTCVTATTAGQSPDTHAAKWELVEIPRFLERYLVQGAYADWLPGDGQNSKKPAALREAEGLLGAQLMVFRAKQSQGMRPEVGVR